METLSGRRRNHEKIISKRNHLKFDCFQKIKKIEDAIKIISPKSQDSLEMWRNKNVHWKKKELLSKSNDDLLSVDKENYCSKSLMAYISQLKDKEDVRKVVTLKPLENKL